MARASKNVLDLIDRRQGLKKAENQASERSSEQRKLNSEKNTAFSGTRASDKVLDLIDRRQRMSYDNVRTNPTVEKSTVGNSFAQKTYTLEDIGRELSALQAELAAKNSKYTDDYWMERTTAEAQRIAYMERDIHPSARVNSTHEAMKHIEQEKTAWENERRELKKKIAAISTEKKMYDSMQTAQAVLSSPDYKEYSEMGANIVNPTPEEVRGTFGGLGEKKEIQNKVTYARKVLADADHYRYSAMTDDEVGVYNYLLAKYGQDKAQEYLDGLENVLTHREGKRIADNLAGIDIPVAEDLAVLFYDAVGGAINGASKASAWFSDEPMPTTEFEAANYYIDKDWSDDSFKVGEKTPRQWLHGTATTVGNMLPSIGVSTVAAELGAPQVAAAALGAGFMAMQSGGAEYSAKLAEGYDREDAYTKGVLTGLSEGGLQMAMGGIGKLGGISNTKLMTQARLLEKPVARIGATAALKLGGEEVEEVAQLYLDPLYNKLVFGEEYKAPTFEEVKDTIIITALSTLALESGNIINAGGDRDRELGEAIIKEGEEAVINTIEAGLHQPTDSGSFVAAQKLEAERKRGNGISAHELGVLGNTLIEENMNTPATIEEAAEGVVREGDTMVENSEDSRKGDMTPMENNLSDGVASDSAARIGYNALASDNPLVQERNARENDIKQATGYGEYGVKAFTDIMENLPEEHSPRVARMFNTAYEAGLTNLDTARADLTTEIQRIAFNAGKQDYIMENAGKVENVKNVVTHGDKAGFDGKDAPSDVTSTQISIIDALYKGLGVKGGIAGANKNANAWLTENEGVAMIASNFDRVIGTGANERTVSAVYHAAHELAMHRLMELAPKEGQAFINALYQHMNIEGGISLAEAKRAHYRSKGKDISISEAVEEVTANNILYLYGWDEQKFADAVERIVHGKDAQAKTGASKFKQILDSIIAKFNSILEKLGIKERAEVQADLDELVKLRDMFENALSVAVAQNKEIAAKQTSESLEIKTNKEYNENDKYSAKAQRGRSIEIETMENNRFERLRQFHDSLPSEWYAFTRDYFYIYSNQSYTDYTILAKVRITNSNRQDIFSYTEELEDVVDRSTEAFNKWVASFRRGKGRNSWHSVSTIRAKATGQNDGMDVRASRSDNTRVVKGSGKHSEIKFSLKDSEGNSMTEAQAEYFKDSKVRDENGSLLVAYHGTDADFTTFDPDFISDDNKLGNGFYFKVGEKLQFSYDNPITAYLNITNPITDTSKKLSEKKVKSFCEKLGLEIDYAVGDADLDVYERLSYTYTGNKKTFLKEAVNILGVDGVLSKERKTAVVFASNQIKRTDNTNPTSNPDIRFSLKEPVEETKDLIAMHNVSDRQLWDAISRGQFTMPSIAVTNKGHTAFGDVSVIFGKDSIDPNIDNRNKLYGSDAWTPAVTELKKNPKFDDVASSEALQGIRKSLGNFAPQLFNSNIGRFKQNIVKADGNFFGAYGHNVGMQAAYAMQNGLISGIPADSEGKVDTGRLKAQLDSVLDGDSEWRAYRKWLSDMSDTIITSFDEASNEDVLNAMKAQPASAKTFKLSENGKLTAPAMEYGSISDFHSNKDRLSEDADKATEALGQDFLKWANEVSRKSKKNVSDVVKAINSSFEGRYNVNDIAKAFTNNGINLSRSDASALQGLYKQAVELPTQYFEAKTHRGVGFDEVKAVVLPDNTSDKLIEQLEETGINVLTYEQGNEADRIAKVNSVESAKFSLKGAETDISVEDVAKLKETINDLKERHAETVKAIKQEFKDQLKVSKYAMTDKKAVEKAAREIVRDFESKADLSEVQNGLYDLYTYMANGDDGNVSWNEVYNRAYSVASNVLKNVSLVDDTVYRDSKRMREYFRTTPIYFNPEYGSDIAGYESFNDFRRANFGRINLTKDGVAIDSLWGEMSSLFPEYFDADEILHPAEMLARIEEALDAVKPIEYNPYSYNMREATIHLANDIIERFYDLPQVKTIADKAKRKVIEARIEGGKKVEKVRAEKDAKIKKAIAEGREKAKKAVLGEKMAAARDMAKMRDKYEKRIEKMSEGGKAKVLRAKILSHASDLSKKLLSPTDKQHIPQNLQGVVAKLLECINLESNYSYDTESHSYKKNDEGLPTRRTQAFRELQKLYVDMAAELVIDPDLMGDGGLLSDVIALSDKRIADMTSSELQTVWETMQAVEATITTANRIFSDGKFETISAVADMLRSDNAGKKKKTELRYVGGVQKLASLDMLTPETYLHMLGDAGDSVFRMMRNAQDKHIQIMKEVADFTHKELKGVKINQLEKKLHTVKLGGEDVQLTTAQLMELYVLMRRDQAKEHILLGGILPDAINKGIKKIAEVEPIRGVQAEEIGKALTLLSAEEKAIAEKLQEFVSTVLSRYGNEASMKVYNYEKFGEKNYWTIRTNKQEIKSEIGQDTAVTTVSNRGFTKGTKPHANTSVRIGSIFDTFSAHSSDMATYAAWLGTSEDVNRIRNFVFWEDGTRTGTVKGILDRVHGLQGAKYLEKLLTDIAIGVKGVDDMNPFAKLTGSYKAAAVGANLRVVIQQPTAILRALDMIAPQYIALGEVRNPLKGWEKAKKYSPIAQWKDWGYFDINTGRQMKDVLFDNADVVEKAKQVGMWGASKADSLSWGLLWNSVEAETKAKHKDLKAGSEEFYKAVAERFTEIIDHTQVVDGILQRSQIMRSRSDLVKMATSFMGEPTKQYNMAVSAAYDAKYKTGDARKKAIGRLGRSVVALGVSGIVNAMAAALVDALRDDDKEKEYWEKWLAAFSGIGEDEKFTDSNLFDTVNPFAYIPFVKDIVSIAQGYDVKRMDTEAISKTYNAAMNMYKALSGESKYTVGAASANLFAEGARLFGLPVANFKRDVKSIAMTTLIETDNYVGQYRMEKASSNLNYSGNNQTYLDILYNAYENDREAYEIIYADMIKGGFDAEKIENGMNNRLKKKAGVKEVTALNKRYLSPQKEKQYDSKLKTISSSEAWKSADKEARQDAKNLLYKVLDGTDKEIVKTMTEGKPYGLDDTEYVLYKLAIGMADEDKNGSYSAIEKSAAIDTLSLGNGEIAYLWGGKQALEAWSYGVDMNGYAGFKGAVSSVKRRDGESDKAWKERRKSSITSLANKYATNEKDWLYFMGAEYDSYKKRSDYKRYFD